MRRIAYEMDHQALSLQYWRLRQRNPNSSTPAVERLNELNMPVLAIVGDQDLSYILAAAVYTAENLSSARKAIIRDTAYLPNMERLNEFRCAIAEFLAGLLEVFSLSNPIHHISGA